MIDSGLVTLLMVAGAGGLTGSLVGLFVALFARRGSQLRVETATGIGFLVGASIGALVGIFEAMLGRL